MLLGYDEPMERLTVSLSPSERAALDSLIARGRFSHHQEAIRSAVQSLIRHEHDRLWRDEFVARYASIPQDDWDAAASEAAFRAWITVS